MYLLFHSLLNKSINILTNFYEVVHFLLQIAQLPGIV